MSPASDPARWRARLRRRFFAAKALEEAALAIRRRTSQAPIRDAAGRILLLLHRSVLKWIAALPPAPPAGGLRSHPDGLGLEAAATRIAPSDPVWARRYAEEAELLQALLRDPEAELHHIGSTAVPGLPAKPVIDLAISLPAADEAAALRRALPRLTGAGYRYVGDRGGHGGHFLEKRRDGLRTHAIQLHGRSSPALAELLSFRDRLRRDGTLARDYAAVKAALAAAVGDDRRIYVWYKSHWINERLVGPGHGSWADYLLRQDPPGLRRLYQAKAVPSRA